MLLWSDFQSRTWLWSIAIGGSGHKEHHQVSQLFIDFLDHVLWFVPDIKTMHASGAEVFISSLLLAEQNLFWEGQSVPPNLRYIVIPLFWRRSRGGPNHLWIYLNTACQHTELSISYFHYRWWNATVSEGLCFTDCQHTELSISYFHYRWWNATVSEGLCFTDCQHTELSISYFHYRWWNATVSEGLCFTDCQLHKSAGSAFYTMRSCAAHIRTTKMDHARHTYSLSLSLAHIYTNPNRRNFIWTNTHKLPFLQTVTDQSECGFQYNGMTIINQVFMYSFVYQHEINFIHSQTNKTWEVVMGWIAWHTWLLLPHANIKPEIWCWKCIQKYHLKISKWYICYRTISKEQSTPDFTLKM